METVRRRDRASYEKYTTAAVKYVQSYIDKRWQESNGDSNSPFKTGVIHRSRFEVYVGQWSICVGVNDVVAGSNRACNFLRPHKNCSDCQRLWTSMTIHEVDDSISAWSAGDGATFKKGAM